ncbi:MAG: hypothetical protein KDJ66_15040, partial [Nitratireductor sp.]|nr:hypothetical protein [Nitratireductor sp.]
VSDFAADWFGPATVPLLTQYCRHTVQARRIAELIERATADPELDVKDYKRLLQMQKAESEIIKGLATTMRISQQSTTNHRGNRKSGKSGKKLWEG